MAHGTPDWGLVGPKVTTYGLDDLGEHAVRLGSPHTWDRRGDVFYQTDFRDGLGVFIAYLSGVGAAMDLVTEYSRWGAYCVRLIGGSDANQFGGLVGYTPVPPYSKVGLEFSCSVTDWTEFWEWRVVWRTGARQYDARVRYDYVNRVLQYHVGGGVFTTFQTNVDVQLSTWITATGKMVFDAATWMYTRFIFNQVTYDLSAYAVPWGAAVAAQYLSVVIRHYAVAGHNPEGLVDSVIVTQNEP